MDKPGGRGPRPRVGPGRRLLLAALLLLGTVLAAARPAPTVRAQSSEGVATLTGTVKVTNPFVLKTITEPVILLNDLANFVTRSIDANPPRFLEVLAELQGDLSDATYTMPLPIAPQATIRNVGHGRGGQGVQIYSVDLQDNAVGDPFIGPFENGAWSTSFTSLTTAEGTNEVTGGKIVVYAPDGNEDFPTGFGADGKLFTPDDPVGPIPAGWTVVDLSAKPFKLTRAAQATVPIEEGSGGLRDYSHLTYTQAFDKLIADLRLRYPFTDYKHVDWDKVVAQFRPRVVRAEQTHDAMLFQVTLMRFAVAIGDGHLGVDPNGQYLLEQFGGNTGLTLGQTDDGHVIVTKVEAGSAATAAGIARGAEITAWGGRPIATALAQQQIIPTSSPHAARLEKLQLLPLGQPGRSVAVEYTNPNAEPATTTLAYRKDPQGLLAAFGGDPRKSTALPVTVKVLDSGLGYIKISTFFDDPVLLSHSWEWALQTLGQAGVPGLIVDVRGNGGGLGQMADYFAGSFTRQPFVLAKDYYADTSGNFIYQGSERIRPAPIRWTKPVALLIDADCASACEIFAAAVAHDTKHLIVGQYPTAGVEAGVFPWLLPDQLSFQAPLIELRTPDGNGIFVEGVGVPPTIKVPVTVESLLSDQDVVLQAAESALKK